MSIPTIGGQPLRLPGVGLLVSPDGPLTVDGKAPTTLSGPIPDDAQFVAVLGTGIYYPWAITSDGVAFCFASNPHPAN